MSEGRCSKAEVKPMLFSRESTERKSVSQAMFMMQLFSTRNLGGVCSLKPTGVPRQEHFESDLNQSERVFIGRSCLTVSE